MRKYIAYFWDGYIDFNPEQYRNLNNVTLMRGEKEVSCKIIPVGNFKDPDFWVCYPVKDFKVEKE
jgi:hypothetical protein